MGTAIKVGTPVRQVVPAPIEGVVVSKKFIEATDSFQYLVEWPDTLDDPDADPQQKWFNEGEIAAVEIAAGVGEATEGEEA